MPACSGERPSHERARNVSIRLLKIPIACIRSAARRSIHRRISLVKSRTQRRGAVPVKWLAPTIIALGLFGARAATAQAATTLLA
jgi:hypothetical protein